MLDARDAGARTSACPTRTGARSRLDDFAGRQALLVMFLCNHCPFVQARARPSSRGSPASTRQRGVGVVAISSNDVAQYPEDGPAGMKAEKARRRLRLPVPVRRDAGGREGLPRRLHARPLPVRRRAAARLPRPARRQPARQRRPGDRAATCARRSTRCSRAGRSTRGSGRASAATSSGSRATSPTTSAASDAEKRAVAAGRSAGGPVQARRTSRGTRRTRRPSGTAQVLVRSRLALARPDEPRLGRGRHVPAGGADRRA